MSFESEKRKDHEKNFHNDYYSVNSMLRSRQRFFYPKKIQTIEHQVMIERLGDLSSKTVLLYGSGNHLSLIGMLVESGASVFVVDISCIAIELIKDRFNKVSIGGGKCTFLVADCERLPFVAESFDVCFGRSILHHLDLDKSLMEMDRLLKPKGKMIFLEPLGINPLINLYRKITPKDRTPFEQPFRYKDLTLFRNCFVNVNYTFLYGSTLLSFIFTVVFKNKYLFERSFKYFHKLDNILLKILPFYHLICWDVIIYGEKK